MELQKGSRPMSAFTDSIGPGRRIITAHLLVQALGEEGVAAVGHEGGIGVYGADRLQGLRSVSRFLEKLSFARRCRGFSGLDQTGGELYGGAGDSLAELLDHQEAAPALLIPQNRDHVHPIRRLQQMKDPLPAVLSSPSGFVQIEYAAAFDQLRIYVLPTQMIVPVLH
jgi:hypothetical protein